MIAICEKMPDPTDIEVSEMMAQTGDVQDILDTSGYCIIDYKISECANSFRLNEMGLKRYVTD